MGNDAIKYELGLVIVGTIVFAVWQLVSLKRDGEKLRAQREAERLAAEAAEKVAAGKAPPSEQP